MGKIVLMKGLRIVKMITPLKTLEMGRWKKTKISPRLVFGNRRKAASICGSGTGAETRGATSNSIFRKR